MIHRCLNYEFVKTIEATSCNEAKEIAEATELYDMINDDDWVCMKHLRKMAPVK